MGRRELGRARSQREAWPRFEIGLSGLVGDVGGLERAAFEKLHGLRVSVGRRRLALRAAAEAEQYVSHTAIQHEKDTTFGRDGCKLGSMVDCTREVHLRPHHRGKCGTVNVSWASAEATDMS